MKRDAVYRRLADLVTAKAGNNKIIKGTQSDRPGTGLVQGFSASGPDVWVTAADYTQPGVVLSAVGARCGKTFLAEGTWTAIANTHVLLPSAAVDHRWLWYLTNDESFWIRGGSAQPFVKVKDTLQKEVDVPPLADQRRIVAILDEAFEGIGTAKTNTEKSLQNARELFKSEAKNAFSDGIEHWPSRTLDQISKNLDRKRVPITKGDRKAGEFPYYGASGIVDYVADYIFEGDALLISEDGANLLARSTPIAFPATGRYWVNNHAHILKFEHMATQRFVEFFLESILLDEYITGAAQPKLNQKALNSIPISIPCTVAEQAQVVERLERIAEQSELLQATYERKLAALDELKRSLLHQAFSGAL